MPSQTSRKAILGLTGSVLALIVVFAIMITDRKKAKAKGKPQNNLLSAPAPNPEDQGVLMETWFNVTGNKITNLTGNPDYPSNPDDTKIVPHLEVPLHSGELYGVRMRAWLYPPGAGTYFFWTASDDASAIFLSPNDRPEGAVQIAKVSGFTGHRNWEASAEQISSPTKLIAGKRYYIEVLFKEGKGKDHLAIAWQGPGIAQQLVPSKYLRPYKEPNPK